ncbi:MAG TPA: (d)CMP kinase [Gemmataceae bacterium]
MIVTIDGPSGSGKSTVARELARRLGFEYLDTGAMFRALAWALLRRGVDPEDAAAVEAALDVIELRAEPGHIRVDGEDVTGRIRTPQVSAAASRVAVIPAVRRYLAERQRAAAAGRDIVCEGRDQGTAVFPEAECKFFLTADPHERARRRYRELRERGENVTFEEVLYSQQERDRRDAERPTAPLRQAEDAHTIDTTDLGIDEVVEKLEREVRRCRGG